MSSELAGAVSIDSSVVERVVEPESVAELCEVLAEAHSNATPCLVVGGGTRLAFGNLGGPFELAVSTRRLNRVLSYEPDDMTLAVESGCPIASIAELLSASGQTIALDAPHSERSTIGGAYATGMSSPRRLGGGSLKDWAIGIEVASPGGTVTKAGGMVVKNVTGYDMMHLHYGAIGAFGIVTRLNLKVFPSPGATSVVDIRFASSDAAFAAGVAVLRSQLLPSSVIVSNDRGWRLLIRCDAPVAAIAHQVQRVIDLATGVAAAGDVAMTDDPATAVEPFLTVTDLLSARSVARISAGASRQPPIVARLVEATAPLDLSIVADVGSGLLHVASQAAEQMVEVLDPFRASCAFLKLPANAKADIDVFGRTDPMSDSLVRNLKAQFDPRRVLNRGRFVLGL